MRRIGAVLAIGLLAAAPGSPASGTGAEPAGGAARLDIVVAHDPVREPDWIELYMALPAADLVRVIGGQPGLLADARGRVDLAGFRRGTFDLADRLFAGVTARADGAPLRLEAMSLMLHPAEAPLPLRTPLDGEIAMSVCGAPIPEVPPSIGDLTAYVGLIAQTDGPLDTLDLVFPGSHAAGRVARVSVHDPRGPVATGAARLDGQGRLSVMLDPQPRPWPAVTALAALAGLALLGRRRGRASRRRPA